MINCEQCGKYPGVGIYLCEGDLLRGCYHRICLKCLEGFNNADVPDMPDEVLESK